MKPAAIIVGFLGLFLGAFYGFASSPDYTKILTYSICASAISIIAFLYWLSASNGGPRIVAITTIALNLVIIAQAFYRLLF